MVKTTNQFKVDVRKHLTTQLTLLYVSQHVGVLQSFAHVNRLKDDMSQQIRCVTRSVLRPKLNVFHVFFQKQCGRQWKHGEQKLIQKTEKNLPKQFSISEKSGGVRDLHGGDFQLDG